jgi:hypothetical protein
MPETVFYPARPEISGGVALCFSGQPRRCGTPTRVEEKAPKMFYTVADFQNPTGLRTSLEKRKANTEFARKGERACAVWPRPSDILPAETADL